MANGISGAIHSPFAIRHSLWPHAMTAAPDIELDGEGPLHQQIRRAIARPILAGAWAPGQRIPSEHELMARYGVSRMTVNRAFASLAEEGLVERKRKAGTVVAAPSAE